MSHLKITNLYKRYGAVEILKDVNLEIKSGEFIVFVGPSGCGKSTLLRCISGLESITSGTLEIDGRVVNEVAPSKRGIAMVFQSYALYPHMTVYDNMAYSLKLQGLPKADIKAKVMEAANKLQLVQYLERLPKALSGGQRQRVAIGRAIVRDPKVFLFDEPLSQPRCGAARADAHGDRPAQGPAAQHDDDLRHARPGRGDDHGRPHRGAEGRRGAAGRHADGALRESAVAVRRRLHRLAEDELPHRQVCRCVQGAHRRACAPSTSRSCPRAPGAAR